MSDEVQREASQPGFWRRVFGGGGEGGEVAGSEAPQTGLSEVTRAEPAEHNRPRKPSRNPTGRPPTNRTGPKDKESERAEQERFSRAAMIRRERLAKAIGERVEEVIQTKMETGEEKLVRVSQSFQEVRTLLGAIGRNLDASAERSERIARALLTLPEAGARGQETLERVLEVLRTQAGQGERGRELLERIGAAIDGQSAGAQTLLGRIAESLDEHSAQSDQEQALLVRIGEVLEGQTGVTTALAESVQGVPQVLALARESQDAARERLIALREVKVELELQRDQRERLISAVRESSERCEARLHKLEEALVVATVQSRQDAGALRGALAGVGERLVAQGKEEGKREEERAQRLEEGLGRLARQLLEGNAVNAAAAASHDRAVARFRDAHGELLDVFQRAQHRTLDEMQRIQEEVSERADQLAKRTRRTLVACAGALTLVVGLGFFWRPGAGAPQAAADAPELRAGQTLPAGMARRDR